MHAPAPAVSSGALVTEVGAWLDSLPLNRRHWTVFAVCAAAFLFDAFDFQAIALAMPALHHEWGLDDHGVGRILAATPAGMLAGTFVFGVVSDRIGRRTAFQVTIGIFALFSAACALATSPDMLIGLRFLAGIGMGGFLPVDTAVMTEFMPASVRGRMMALWAIFFSVGLVVATLVGWLVIPAFGWRVMFLLCLVPAVMILGVRRWIPETPRWLIEHGRLPEAREAVTWVAQGRTCAALDPSRMLCRNHVAGPQPALTDLFAPALRARTAVAWLAWTTWSFAYFGLLLWLPSLLIKRGITGWNVFFVMAAYTASGIPGRYVASRIVDRVGRKALIVGSSLISAALMVLFGLQSSLWSLAVCGVLLALFQDAGLGTVAGWTPELFPTRLRASGTGAASGVGRMAIMAAPIAAAAVLAIGYEYVFVMFAGAYLIAAIGVAALGRETKQMVLEQACAAAPSGTAAGTPDARGAAALGSGT